MNQALPDSDTDSTLDKAPPAVTSAAEVEVDQAALADSIGDFTEHNSDYYIGAFQRIHETAGVLPSTFNWMAALVGPPWAAARGLWGFFWGFLLLEIIAWVQIGRGLWGQPGAEDLAQAARQEGRAEEFLARAEQARAAGEDPSRFETLAGNLQRAAERGREAAETASAEALGVLLAGLVMLVIFKLIQGLWANNAYEKQYSAWRINHRQVESGFKRRNIVMGIILTLAIAPLTIYKFTVDDPDLNLETFPANPGHYTAAANWLESHIDDAAAAGAGAFDSIVFGVRSVLDTVALALMGAPWAVVMTVICVVAWRSAGPRVAIFTAASLAYIAFLGYWEIAMETVALVGSAVIICVMIGIPAGIWFGKSRRAYVLAEPVLDLMQTLPAFVYLIPIIAFFGTGNPPGILATIIFGMPPVVRLTALGMRGVPDSIKEAATAFGASRWQVLKGVEIPLALPSIMAGVNQTILMCLSMVVIISLIGGGGLGKVILEALQYAAKGPGLLGGLAILLCAMVIDRIVQGAFRNDAGRK